MYLKRCFSKFGKTSLFALPEKYFVSVGLKDVSVILVFLLELDATSRCLDFIDGIDQHLNV